MPDPINSALVNAKNEAHSTTPWVWLFDVDLDGTSLLSVAGHDTAVTYNGRTYAAFPIAVSGLERNSLGDLPTPTVTVTNLSREIASYLESEGILDRRVRIYLINTVTESAVLEFGEWRVLDAALSLDAASFRLGVYQLFDAPFPSRRQMRGRCDHVYGGVECGYDLTLTNLISASAPNFDIASCDYTLDGDNGCIKHGLNEVAHGRPKNHPKRFGGHIGIPKGPARV